MDEGFTWGSHGHRSRRRRERRSSPWMWLLLLISPSYLYLLISTSIRHCSVTQTMGNTINSVQMSFKILEVEALGRGLRHTANISRARRCSHRTFFPTAVRSLASTYYMPPQSLPSPPPLFTPSMVVTNPPYGLPAPGHALVWPSLSELIGRGREVEENGASAAVAACGFITAELG